MKAAVVNVAPEPKGFAQLFAFPFVVGLGIALGFAPVNALLLVIVPMAIWIVCITRTSNLKTATLSSFAFGLGMFLAGVSWVYVSMHTYGHMPMPLAVIATVLFAAYLALFPALAGFIVAWLRRRSGISPTWVVLLLAPAAWAASEWLRAWLFTGFPWLMIGYSQVPVGWLGGFAPLMGVFGVGWLLVLQAGLIVLAWRAWRQSVKQSALLLSACIGIGVAGWVLGKIEWSQPVGEPVKVALLQGNIPQDRKWLEEVRVATLVQYQRMIEASDARLIVLPETSMPMFLDQVPDDYLAALSATARQRDASILLGTVVRTAAEGAFDYYNSLIVIGEGAGQQYRKSHLVPFGEYIPTGFGWILSILKIPLTDFAPVDVMQKPLAVAGQKVAANICYEDGFGNEIIRAVPDATMLVNVSNVAWFGRSWAADQHFQMSQMRSLETSRWTLRATNTGVTGAIDERGWPVRVLPQHEAGVLNVSAQGRTGLTPYARWGDWPVLIGLIAAFSLCFAGFPGSRSLRERGETR